MNGSSNRQGQKCFLKMSQHNSYCRTDDTVEGSAAGRIYGDGNRCSPPPFVGHQNRSTSQRPWKFALVTRPGWVFQESVTP